MDRVIPWATLTALVAPHYVKPGRGRRPMPLETMRRTYFLQQWFNLSDPQAEDMLYDSESMRRFARVELGEDTVPDESTILRFRHLLEAQQLTARMFDAVRDLLVDRDVLMTTGTIVDATLIAAPSSTKNATKTRDPEMRQTRKGKSWYFGMKCHIGTDPQGFVHTLVTPDAAHSDIGQLPHLVHGLEETLHGDKAYWKEADRVAYEAAGGQYLINQRGERTPERDALNRERSRIRARGAHVFHVVKVLWGFTKVRYRGLMKNTVRALAVFALANLFLARKRLLPAGTSCRRECRRGPRSGPIRPVRGRQPRRRRARRAYSHAFHRDVIHGPHAAHLCRVSLSSSRVLRKPVYFERTGAVVELVD